MSNEMRLRRMALASCLVLAAVFMTAASAEAQNTSQVFGRVTDTSGAVMPGVTVTLSSPALLEARVAVTSETGTYEFSGLPLGVYAVKFELSGFSTLVRDGVRFIRLRQVAVDPHGWSIVELRVIR